MNDEGSQPSREVYNNDPVSLKSYVNKTVSIKTRDGHEHTGVVYTIDPLSESIILINQLNEELNMKIIMGHVIEDIEISSEPETSVPDMFLSSGKDFSDAVILTRKNAVKELLLANRFPVTEEDDNVLNIQGKLSIEPPYDQENCISNNEIVLLRIQQLISSVVS